MNHLFPILTALAYLLSFVLYVRFLGTGKKLTGDRKSTRLNSSHSQISYAVFCLKNKIERCLATQERTARCPRGFRGSPLASAQHHPLGSGYAICLHSTALLRLKPSVHVLPQPLI